MPAGKYKAEITTATVGPTKNGRGQMVNLTWTIAEGDYEKRLVFQNILIQHDERQEAQRFGRQKFKDVCIACGVTGRGHRSRRALVQDCVITVIIRKDKDGQYPDKNEIARVMPMVASKPATQSSRKPPRCRRRSRRQSDFFDDEIPF